jgi:hypothetical protein
MAVDEYKSHKSEVDSPVRHAIAVTPSDSADLATASRAIYIGGAGNIQVTTVDGDTVTMNGVTAGSFYPIRVARVWSTGTTATNIQSWW